MAGETVRAVLNHVWHALEPLGYPCDLMGGAALALWNHPRATRDIDLLIGVESSQINRVIDQLVASGCRLRSSPPIMKIGDLQFVQFLYTPPNEFYDVQFDLWLADTDLQKSAIARRVRRNIPGVSHSIDVITCDDLILFKLLAGRIIDRADAAHLIRENRDTIGIQYLLDWVDRLDLSHHFAEVWDEAYPGEELPSAEQS